MTAVKQLCRRGTSNSNDRGGAPARRKRKERMLAPYGGHGGNYETVPCYRCKVPLTYSTLQVDRIVAGMDGGSYAWNNIRPACQGCNTTTGNQLRDHRVKFPLGSPVVFARNRMFWTHEKVLYDIVDGESEALLTLRNRVTGRTYRNINRNRLLAVSAPDEPRG